MDDQYQDPQAHTSNPTPNQKKHFCRRIDCCSCAYSNKKQGTLLRGWDYTRKSFDIDRAPSQRRATSLTEKKSFCRDRGYTLKWQCRKCA
ncbi:hypothetical protein M6B38_267740 [Iris pallida]|uniref:Uncharacterized protein n=1 Tax=Iris pallida TaxID=29817 RepID=A0AAX6H0Q2_IRIPA|nr:hypothetical protein M6B38_335285 [Iris pallida]KAJ6849588.1 hypothetical protein M6B38_267740 [Iris pallida]